mmetsp:Transcript_5265/g.10227  ORF Transcript_5265/g.10227 Transcript_5265/m.10227 type:complete len:87 (+) Transcript_5265:287-547(+)
MWSRTFQHALNQDCYDTRHADKFGDGYNDSSAFLAVYDGHGPPGELVSTRTAASPGQTREAKDAWSIWMKWGNRKEQSDIDFENGC